MKAVYFFLNAAVLLSACLNSGHAAVDAPLPEDVPAVPEIVHHLKYPQTETNQIEVGLSYLYGDKFLSTQGISIQDYYHLSETLAVGGAVSFYHSAITDEAAGLHASGANPLMYNPSFLLRMSVLYEPLYGKIAIGNFIENFRIGVDAGLHVAQESRVFFDPGTQDPTGSKMAFGPCVGARIWFPIFNQLSFVLRADLFLHGTLSDAEAGSRHLWVGTGSLGYQL